MPVYASEQCLLLPTKIQQKRIPKIQKRANSQIPEFYNLLLPLQKFRKTKGVSCFKVFWCILFLKLYYAWKGFWWPNIFVFLHTSCLIVLKVQPLISIFTQTIFYLTVPKSNLYRNHLSPARMHSQKTALLLSTVLLWKHWRQRRNTSHHSKRGEDSRRKRSPGSLAKQHF